MIDFVYAPDKPAVPSYGIQTKLIAVMRKSPPETVWQSKDLAKRAKVRRGSARSALQALITKLLVTYAYKDGEPIGFRLVVEKDWK